MANSKCKVHMQRVWYEGSKKQPGAKFRHSGVVFGHINNAVWKKKKKKHPLACKSTHGRLTSVQMVSPWSCALHHSKHFLHWAGSLLLWWNHFSFKRTQKHLISSSRKTSFPSLVRLLAACPVNEVRGRDGSSPCARPAVRVSLRQDHLQQHNNKLITTP